MTPATEDQKNGEHLAASRSEAEAKSVRRPVILVFSDFYLPGYKSGGGMRTLVNIVDRFGDDYDFRIVTRDHDGKTDKTAYPDISYGSWVRVGKSLVRYLSKEQIRIGEIKRIARAVGPDIIFFNSYFSTLTIFALLLRRLGMLRGIPMVIAPQGELADAGLELKRTKKQAFLRFGSKLRLYRDIVWRTTSEVEAGEVDRAKGSGGRVFIAPDLPARVIYPDYTQEQKAQKESGSVRLVYLSRIHPKKNPVFLLELLAELEGCIQLDLVGPIDADDEYIESCRVLIEKLPSNIRVKMAGGVPHEQVFQTLVGHDFFVLPTITENFGHVFLEAMAAGCPLLISDRTPWKNLEQKGVGWDLPLEDRGEWIEVLRRCIDMDQETFVGMSRNARQFAEDWVGEAAVEKANREVFEYALSLSRGV
ncbi:MAG: glycosyltransferase [Pyrinomonadaceae bacterium]